MKALLALLKSRLTGAIEMVDMMLGHFMYLFDTSHEFLNTNESNQRARLLRPADVCYSKTKVLQEVERTGLLFYNNFVDWHYPQRSPMLEDYCMYNVRAYYDISVHCLLFSHS